MSTTTPCVHNHRIRFTHGFLCDDCDTFFPKESEVYRSDEYLSDLWMACHNVNVEAQRSGNPEVVEAVEMRDKIGIGKHHYNYEDIISEAEAFLAKHGSHGESAIVTLH